MTSQTTSIYVYLLIFLLTGCGFPSESRKLPSPANNSCPTNESMITEVKDMINLDQLISAQVLLAPAMEKQVDGNTLITSENIDDYRPSAKDTSHVSQYFRNQGFEVSPLVGISFSISASAQHFSDVFQVTLTESESGGIQAMVDSNIPCSELPLGSLDHEIVDLLISITFVSPPDFGPTNFSF